MAPKLYLDLCSQPCRAIVIFARMNNINLNQERVSFIKEETRTEWFKKVTPMQAVPVLVDDDFTLTESVAILRYLSKRFPVAAHWFPSDLQQRALVDEYVAWQYCGGGLRPNAARVFIEKGLIPHKKHIAVDEPNLQDKINILNPILDKIESYFLSRSPFIAGTDDVTIADLLCICEMMQPISVGFDVTEDRPKLAKWFERVKTRLQPHFNEVHQEIVEFGSKYK